ncbi:NADH-quinone oxidoreductase subunit M [bacterium]|nr:NADH-quinone oxidoreductase subunit M [FCB group bacterium]MBL7190243.1 NADH-quinone oxidoreductase subunit M [bacterium]
MDNILTLTIFIPLAGAVILLFLPRSAQSAIKITALIAALAAFAVSIPLFFLFDVSNPDMQFVERHEWIPSIGVYYQVGIDGISLFLVLLTTFLSLLCIYGSFGVVKEKLKAYMFCFLFLEMGMLGVFCALDLFLFYVFWESMLIPMYFIIGVWGGPRRIYAALKFFIYTMVGSVLMLAAIIYLYLHSGDITGVARTFDLFVIMANAPQTFALQAQMWLFAAFALAFAIKVPMFPFHTWLPDAHVEAPAAGSVILAGVLLKMGTYGFLRFCIPLFPAAAKEFVPLISVLAIIGIIYGALVSMVQTDLKKLVAYSSVSHLGFVMLGLFAFTTQAVVGGVVQMINHGLSTGALFFLVGVIYERRHTREIKAYGGLAKQMPKYAAVFMIVTLSSLGLPGLNGFIGEFLILLGTFQVNQAYAIFAASGVILTAVYLLWMYRRVMFGPLDKEENKNLKDLNLREWLVFMPLLICIVWIGVYPYPILIRITPAVEKVLMILK